MRVKTLAFPPRSSLLLLLVTHFVLALMMEINTAPQLNKMAEHNLEKSVYGTFLFVKQPEEIFLGASQALNLMRWRGEGEHLVKQHEGE